MDDSTWQLIEAERRSLADLLDGLAPEQWQARSLCEEWRIRDVAAHLIMTPAGAPSPWTMAAALVRTRGRLWPAGRDVAIAYADRPDADIAAAMRHDAAKRTKPVFVNADNILLDLLVHGQDIAVPLGLDRAVPEPAAQVALPRTWSMRWPFHARRRLSGFTLRATDCAWSAGEGPEVSGTAGDLLLLMTQRTGAALARLHGPGVALLSDDRAHAGGAGP